jgi:hypothetical protein
MKNKYLLTVKYAVASAILGVFGFVGLAAIDETPASAADVVLSININQVPYSLTVVAPVSGGAVGDTFSLNLEGENINTVSVYVDFNGDSNYEPGELLSTFNLAIASPFGPNYLVGPVTIPNNTPPGQYNMKVVGTQLNGGNEETSVVIPIDYSLGAPQVSAIVPNHGSTAGGTNIIITGQNFDATSKVFIGNNECLNVVVVNSNKITCTTPAGAAGHVRLTIENANGIYTDDYGFLYKEYPTADGGGGIFGLPNVPNTGLFRVGNTVVMSSDLMIAILTIVVIVLGVLLVKHNKNTHKQAKKSPRKPTKNGAKAAPAKRVRTKKPQARRK